MRQTVLQRTAEWGGRSFYRIKNKEQGRKKDKISDYPGPQSTLFRVRGQSWLGVWRLADWVCVSGQMEHLRGHKSYLNFHLLA